VQGWLCSADQQRHAPSLSISTPRPYLSISKHPKKSVNLEESVILLIKSIYVNYAYNFICINLSCQSLHTMSLKLRDFVLENNWFHWSIFDLDVFSLINKHHSNQLITDRFLLSRSRLHQCYQLLTDEFLSESVIKNCPERPPADITINFSSILLENIIILGTVHDRGDVTLHYK